MRKIRQMKKYLLISFVFFFTITLTAEAAGINGNYIGDLGYKRGTPFGSNGACYTREQYPVLPLDLEKVKLKRNNKVSGLYNNGYTFVAAKGQKTRSGFKVKFSYTQSGYKFVYNITVSKIGKVSARVSLAGKTYVGHTKSGCHYAFNGTVARS